MAEKRSVERGINGNNTFLAFILGAVVLAIGVMGYLMLEEKQTQNAGMIAPGTSGMSSLGGANAPSNSDSGNQ